MIRWKALRDTDCQKSQQEDDRSRNMKGSQLYPKETYIYILFTGIACAIAIAVLPKLSIWFHRQQVNYLSSAVNEMISSEYTQFGKHRTSVALRKMEKKRDDVKGEALSALHLAKDMTEKNKPDKALKLYQHALALYPIHADILNEYGEFLEKQEQDIVTAEHLYSKALIISPEHSRALSNRQRTLPLVEEIDQNTFNRIGKKLEHLITVPDSHPGLKRMKKESYFKHIHNTVAIEGNTFTLAQTRSLVETQMAIGGKSIMEHNEILGMDAAYSFVNNTLVHRIGAITIKDVLEIHKRVLGYVDLNEAGRFRTTQVFIGDYTPPSASQIDSLMQEFIEWLNCGETMKLHPIEISALAHYKLVSIHPFYDGNGRTSRLLMNLILMQSGYPPIVVKKEEKHEYYQHLETANAGDVRPFIRFIAMCTERTLDDYILATSDLPNATLQALLGRHGIEDDERIISMPGDENGNH